MIGGNTLNTAVIGDTLSISGKGFSTAATENLVFVHNIPARVVTTSPTSLHAIVPVSVPFAYVDVVVARKGYQSAVHQIQDASLPDQRKVNLSYNLYYVKLALLKPHRPRKSPAA